MTLIGTFNDMSDVRTIIEFSGRRRKGGLIEISRPSDIPIFSHDGLICENVYVFGIPGRAWIFPGIPLDSIIHVGYSWIVKNATPYVGNARQPDPGRINGMVKKFEAQSQLARKLGMSRNEVRFLTQMIIGQWADQGRTPQLTRVGPSLAYDDALSAEVHKLAPTFVKGKDIYMGK